MNVDIFSKGGRVGNNLNGLNVNILSFEGLTLIVELKFECLLMLLLTQVLLSSSCCDLMIL